MDEEMLPEEAFRDDMPLDELVVTDLPPIAKRTLNLPILQGWRPKIIAAVVAVLALTLVASMRWGSGAVALFTVPTPTAIPIQTIAGLPPQQIIGASTWQQIPLPVPDATVESLQTAVDNPNLIYVCAGTRNFLSDPSMWGPVTLWRTTDAARHWQRILAPPDQQAFCHFSLDADNAQHVVVYAEDVSPNETQTPCAGSIAVSENGGDTWQSQTFAPLHTAVPFSPSDCELAITTQGLYMVESYSNNSATTQQYREYAVTLRSADNGATWHDITPIKPDGFTMFWPILVSGATLIGRSVNRHSTTITSTLWVSHDAGGRWQRMQQNSLPNINTLFSLPGNSAALYGVSGTSLSSEFFAEHALYSADGAHWRFLPNLPATNTTAQHAGIFAHLGVTAQGNLLIVGIGAGASLPVTANGNLNTQPVPLYVWEWDHTHQRWGYVPAALPIAEPLGCGGCFQSSLAHGTAPDGIGMGTYLIIRIWESSPAWRIFIPDSA